MSSMRLLFSSESSKNGCTSNILKKVKWNKRTCKRNKHTHTHEARRRRQTKVTTIIYIKVVKIFIVFLFFAEKKK